MNDGHVPARMKKKSVENVKKDKQRKRNAMLILVISGLTDWLTDWLIDCLTDRPTDGWMTEKQAGSQIDSHTDWLIYDWEKDWMTG